MKKHKKTKYYGTRHAVESAIDASKVSTKTTWEQSAAMSNVASWGEMKKRERNLRRKTIIEREK